MDNTPAPTPTNTNTNDTISDEPVQQQAGPGGFLVTALVGYFLGKLFKLF